MTTNLNFHARRAIERVALDVRSELVEYWRGEVPVSRVTASTKGLRAQSRATRQIAPREADAILGTAALVEILSDASERFWAANDINRSDQLVRDALAAIDGLRGALETRP